VTVEGDLRVEGSGFTTYWNTNATLSTTGTLSLNDSIILTGNVTATAGSDGSGDLVLNGNLSGAGFVIKAGAQTLTLNGANS
jgi:hypothetical protein